MDLRKEDPHGVFHFYHGENSMDSNSVAKLSKVHPVLAKKIAQLIAVLANLGMDVRVVQGVRTYAQQNDLYAQGRTKPGNRVTNARGGQSNHNFGLAVDLCPFKNNQPDWNDAKAFQTLGKEAKKLELEWGGDWAKIKDMPHVQLRGMSVKECQSAYSQGGLERVWQRMYEILGGAKPETFVPTPDDVLEFGDKGAQITKLQQQLAELKFLQAQEIDGDFGKITKRAVIGFQRQYDLTADGIVGQGTLAKLLSALESQKTLNSVGVQKVKDTPKPEEKQPESSADQNQSGSTSAENQPIQVPQVSAEPEEKKEVPGIKASAAAAVTFLTATGGGIFALLKDLQQEMVYGFFGAAAVIGVVFIVMRFWYANKEKDRESQERRERESRAHEVQMVTIKSAMDKNLNAVQVFPQPLENSEPKQ